MAHNLSDVAAVRVDDDSGTSIMVTISGDITNVAINGGNGLVEDTGLGDANRTEQRDIGTVKGIALTGMMNSTTMGIYGPLAARGTSITKTIEIALASGQFISGEANIGPVALSIPVGLQTFTAEYRSTSGSGFDYTSVAI